jgi:hypothetical protein
LISKYNREREGNVLLSLPSKGEREWRRDLKGTRGKGNGLEKREGGRANSRGTSP